MQIPESRPVLELSRDAWTIIAIIGGLVVVGVVANAIAREPRRVPGTRCPLCSREGLDLAHVSDIAGLRGIVRTLVAVVAGMASALFAGFSLLSNRIASVSEVLLAIYALIVALAAAKPLHARAVLRCPHCTATWPRG